MLHSSSQCGFEGRKQQKPSQSTNSSEKILLISHFQFSHSLYFLVCASLGVFKDVFTEVSRKMGVTLTVELKF